MTSASWVLIILIWSGANVPPAVTTVTSYPTQEKCLAAGEALQLADTQAREGSVINEHRSVSIEYRCFPGSG
jgi:hypothetical protein